ncbi:MAG: NHLP-related RiPP peptide, partial [Actinomycetota bacterium]|nr:NHLP-related RiPP peptide [Actinomycetota bacterium]
SELFDQILNQREEPAVSSQEVKHVLNQLLTDEDFRSQFQGDPEAALQDLDLTTMRRRCWRTSTLAAWRNQASSLPT